MKKKLITIEIEIPDEDELVVTQDDLNFLESYAADTFCCHDKVKDETWKISAEEHADVELITKEEKEMLNRKTASYTLPDGTVIDEYIRSLDSKPEHQVHFYLSKETYNEKYFNLNLSCIPMYRFISNVMTIMGKIRSELLILTAW